MAINFNDTLPAAPAGRQNVAWQVDVSGNASANVPSTPGLLPGIDTTGLVADVATADIIALSATARYRVSGYIIVTTADGASSTLPKITVSWIDADNNTLQTKDITATQTGNSLTTFDEGEVIVSSRTANPIQYETSGYASGTPATMTYALHIVLELLS